MIKITPFIQTSGSNRFKDFLLQKFTIDMLYPIYDENSCDTLFYGWQGNKMTNHFEFKNENNVVLEFHTTHYTIKSNIPNEFVFPFTLPVTINDFINTLMGFGIQLYWTEWIDNNFEPYEYLHINEVESYFTDLLNKMGKSDELLT